MTFRFCLVLCWYVGLCFVLWFCVHGCRMSKIRICAYLSNIIRSTGKASRKHESSAFLYVISCCSRLQLSFSENGPLSSSEEKERVAETDDTCYGKTIGFGSQPMKIAEASSRGSFRFFEIVQKNERCFRYHAFPQDRTAIKVVVRPHCKMDQGKHTLNLHPTQEENKHGRSKKYHLGGI